jgi:hypothetical protein
MAGWQSLTRISEARQRELYMATCINRAVRRIAWAISVVLTMALSACGGGDNVNTAMPAASPAPVAAAGAVQQAPTPLSPTRQSLSTEVLVDNFEAGMDGWSNWGNAQVIDGAGVAGSRAMRVGTGAGGGSYNVWEAMAGSTYRVTAQARVTDASETLFVGVNIITPTGTVVATQVASISSTSYSRVSMDVKVPDSGAYGADVFVWKNAGAGYGFVDDVTFTYVYDPPPPPPPPDSNNLIANSGFESGMTNWVNWANAAVMEGTGISGSSGLRVGTAAGGAAQDVAGIVAGRDYQLSARVRVSAAGDVAYLGINMLDASGNVVLQRILEFSGTVYETVSAQLAAPASAVKAVVFVWKNASSGYAFVDEVALASPGTAPPPPPQPPPPSGVVNLLSNPGFESGMSNWVDWGNTVVSAGVGASGSANALRVGTQAGGAGQDVGSIVAGAQYRLAASVRVSDASETGYIGVNLVDAAGNNVDQQVMSFNNTSYATLASAEFQAPAGAVRALVYVWKNSGGGYAYVDNFEFGRVGATATNYVVNGGFENQLASWRAFGGTVVTDAASGTYAAAASANGGMSQDVSLVPGRTYRLSAQTKLSGTVRSDPLAGPSGVLVFMYDAWGDEVVGMQALPLPVSGGNYMNSSFDFTVHPQATLVSVYVLNWTGDGYLFADDISIVAL